MSTDTLAQRLGMEVPVIAAPMAGGTSTPALVAAVCEAGAAAFLPAGYLGPDQLRTARDETRALTRRPFGVNLFVPGSPTTEDSAVRAYAAALAPEAARLEVELGEPRWDDDRYAAKLDVLADDPAPVVSFTFGCPSADDVARLHRAGSLVLITVTSAAEARAGAEVGADGLVVQGAEAGGHSAGWHDDPSLAPGANAVELLPLLAQVRAEVDLPLVAAGGLMTGRDVATVRAAGANAGQLGTAFLCTPEAGTRAPHRAALLERRYDATALTRVFTGRTARALVTPFLSAFQDQAPAAYPEVHHLTRPLRAAAAAAGDTDRLHLWAGEGWAQVRALPATTLVRTLAGELASVA